MKKTFIQPIIVATAAALTLGKASAVVLVDPSIPYAIVTIETLVPDDLQSQIVANGAVENGSPFVYQFQGEKPYFLNVFEETPDAFFTIIAIADPDPFISIFANYSNTTNLFQNVSFTFSSPLVLADGAFDYTLTLNENLSGRPATSITPDLNANILTASLAGPSLFVAGLDSVGLSALANSSATANYATSGSGVKSGNTGFEAVLSFTISPHATANFDGTFEITQKTASVPETGSSLGMLGLSLLGVGLIARKKKTA